MDVGAATIAAFVNKWDLGSVTEGDLDEVAEYAANQYVANPLKSFLNVAFPNSGFTQPAFESRPEKRASYANSVLRAARAPGASDDRARCVFTGKDATSVAFSETLPPGRAFRQHIPMITGEGFINFYPWGDAGLPVSGEALLCIQVFPLGCAKCGGKLLAVHSDNPDLIREFAGEFLSENGRAVQLAQESHSTKMPEARASAKTLLVDTLLRAERRRRDEAREERPSSVTAYHLTNSGQSNPLDVRNPPLSIYYLPTQVTGFLRAVATPEYSTEWGEIVRRAWRLARKQTPGNQAEESADDGRPRHNYLYEDLFCLPDRAGAFVRRYLLRVPVRSPRTEDPRREYSLRREADLVSWKLTDLFLRKVIGMDKERISQIRDLGDRLAGYVDAEADWGFLRGFFDHRYDRVRMALIKANNTNLKRGREPLITLDPYLEVFEDGDELARADWRLARDLVYIRVVEQLYERGRLRTQPDVLPEAPADTEEVAS